VADCPPPPHGSIRRCKVSRLRKCLEVRVFLPRHERAAFGGEPCGEGSKRGSAAPGGGQADQVRSQFAFMSVSLMVPVRDGSCDDRDSPISIHRNGKPALVCAGERRPVSCRNGAAIKSSLTLSWLILPRCPQAP